MSYNKEKTNEWGYLGETIVDIKDTPFKDYKKKEWMMYFLETYGQYDGAHHKSWVLDQIAQIYYGTKILIKIAKWKNGMEEFRVYLSNPSLEYMKWVEKMDDYDSGIAP